MGDLSNSPGLEMIVGNLRGGVGFYNTINPDGISENENLDNLIRLFPNPTSGIINLITDVEFIYDLKIINLTGQVVKELNRMIGNQQLDVKDLLPGMYIIHIVSDKQHMQIKFVKE
jgi:hypothetical protein